MLQPTIEGPPMARGEATAYHEAGHAVIAHALGYKPHSVTVVPTVDFHGHAVHSNPLYGIQLDIDGSDGARLRAEKAIVICFAGPLAQQRYNPRSWRRHHGQADYDLICDLGMRVCGSAQQVAAFLRWLEIVAREKVEAQWPRITNIAEILLKRKHLRGAEFMVALQPATVKRGVIRTG
jgi:hypothetical protein